MFVFCGTAEPIDQTLRIIQDAAPVAHGILDNQQGQRHAAVSGWAADLVKGSAIEAALGFDKLGLPYYMPGWQQPSAVLDLLVSKDKWASWPATLRAQIETACRANIAWTLGRAPHIQAVALEKLKAAGVVIKQWPQPVMDAFRSNTELVLKERADADPEFAAAWANQKAFVAQGLSWRTMSRLP